MLSCAKTRSNVYTESVVPCLTQTPLHLSVITDRSDIVRRLLDLDASPNVTDRRGQTCYHVAVTSHSVDCLRTLIDDSPRSPDVDAMSYDGQHHTPLSLQLLVYHSRSRSLA